MKPKMILCPVLLYISFCPFLYSQGTDIQPVSQNAYSPGYLENLGNKAVIFSGRVHEPTPLRTESLYLRDRNSKQYNYNKKEEIPRPVPTDETYTRGSLKYDGTLYNDLHLRLDLITDQLVVRTPDRLYGLILSADRVEYADFHGYRVFYVPPGDPTYKLPGGYYRELHNGDMRVIMNEKLLYDPADDSFKSWSVRFYILKDGDYQRVRGNKGSILNALGSHKKELSRFIKMNRISVKNDTEDALVRIVSEYEKLNQQASL